MGNLIDQDALAALEDRYDRFVATHTAPPPTPFAGASGTELGVIAQELDRVEAAERQAAAAVAALPEVEAALAQAGKTANGKWVLLGAIVLIVLAVLIGQVL
ncbi:MAG TPA: hypothetical protein PKE40_01165 [Arachnia sp.]|nr:hypothetical protein [Arachnia sp.]HMT84937.1 hypothetical protein [Arachnia sp.]